MNSGSKKREFRKLLSFVHLYIGACSKLFQLFACEFQEAHILPTTAEREVFENDRLLCTTPSVSAGSVLVEWYSVRLLLGWALTFQIYAV